MLRKITAIIFALTLTVFAFVSCDNGEETTYGEKINYTLKVTHSDGTEREFQISSSEKYVGYALQNENIISGENGPYGLYIKTVDGETLDYDKDGKYWAFYENGSYAMAGVDTTEAKDGVTYELKAE